MVPLDEETQLRLAEYLAAHKPMPARGMGTVKLEFQSHPVERAPALEPLIGHRGSATWLIRWPGGSLRWVTEDFLRSRGFPVPTDALVAELDDEGRATYRWSPEPPSEWTT